jgi:drug/metabolite transporter (DMT)-like permease
MTSGQRSIGDFSQHAQDDDERPAALICTMRTRRNGDGPLTPLFRQALIKLEAAPAASTFSKPSMPEFKTGTRPAGSAARGIRHMILAVFLFSCMDALIKWAAADYPIGQIVFFRNAVALTPLFFYLRGGGGVGILRTSRPGGHVLRGVVGVSAMICIFTAFALMPLADAVALSLSGPIFLTALSVPLLGEKVGIRRWSAVVVGFVGILIMTRPGIGVFQPAALLAIGGALFYALAMISVRRLSMTEPAASIVFYFTLFATVVGALSLPFQWVTPDLLGFMALAGIGLIGGFAQLAMTQAFRLSPVAVIAPFDYGALVFAVGFGYLIWRDVPDVFIVVGSLIVIASGLYILHRETQLSRQRRKQLSSN